LFFNSEDAELEGVFKDLNEVLAKNNKKLQFSGFSPPLISETEMKRTPLRSSGIKDLYHSRRFK